MKQYQRQKLGLAKEDHDPFWRSLLLDKKFKLMYLPRKELHGADELIKDGRISRNMIFFHGADICLENGLVGPIL